HDIRILSGFIFQVGSMVAYARDRSANSRTRTFATSTIQDDRNLLDPGFPRRRSTEHSRSVSSGRFPAMFGGPRAPFKRIPPGIRLAPRCTFRDFVHSVGGATGLRPPGCYDSPS